MYYNHNLRTNLQEWKNNLIRCNHHDFQYEFRFFFSKVFDEPILNNIINDVIQDYPVDDSSLQKWYERYPYGIKYKEDKHRTSVYLHFCKNLYDENEDASQFLYMFGIRDLNGAKQAFVERLIIPIISYLHEQLDNVNFILYLLEKYKLRTEWFTRGELKAKYQNASKQYENIFEDDIRLFLFDQGVEYPFSTPKSASGRADVVSLINTEDPLVMEIKIYDTNRNYGKDRIISGFTQIAKYTNDYHKNIGYLVVFNLDEVEIEIEGELDDKWPNRVLFNGKTYYIIIINLNNEKSASKTGTLKKLSISTIELTASL